MPLRLPSYILCMNPLGLKSVIKLVMRFFKEFISWKIHREFTVCALQLLPLSWVGKLCNTSVASQQFADKPYGDWQGIHAICKVCWQKWSTQRVQGARITNFFKRNQEGKLYSFGGVNITLVGDMLPLDPLDDSLPPYSVRLRFLIDSTPDSTMNVWFFWERWLFQNFEVSSLPGEMMNIVEIG